MTEQGSRTRSPALVSPPSRPSPHRNGGKAQQERWKRCVQSTQGALGELVAQPYLDRRFDKESKAAAEQMIAGIRQAFGDDLGQIAWMDPKTKARAASKLQTIAFQIGYPSKWRTYDFDVDPGNRPVMAVVTG